MATKTQNPGRRNVSPGILPKALRNNQEYLKAYEARGIAHHDLHNAVGALNSARKKIKDHHDYDRLDSAAKKVASETDYLTPTDKDAVDAEIDDAKTIIDEEHGKFAAAHQKMRDMEHAAGVDDEHRLARTRTFPNKGKMYGKFGIYNINASHIAEKDKMESVKSSPQQYYMGGRRKKTRKKRRRKNKRKTKRRKKTRRRKKRRKKRRTKRR